MTSIIVPTDKKRFGTAWILGMLLLLICGVGYKIVSARIDADTNTPIRLPVSLSEFPMKIGSWVGRDVPISETVLKVAGNDDYLCRQYVSTTDGAEVTVYVAYSARPRTMVGHLPKVCYPANGWIMDSDDRITIKSNSGRAMDCILYRFHKPSAPSGEIVVLSYYIVNGEMTYDENVFSGIGWRTPNIAGDHARYVAQIQISSNIVNSVRIATEDIADLLASFFPK